MTGRVRRMGSRMAALAVAAIGVVAIAGTALAGHQTSGVKSYTGCLVSGDGVLVKIKEGNVPRSACTGGQVEAHFSGGDITAITAQAGGGLTRWRRQRRRCPVDSPRLREQPGREVERQRLGLRG